MYIRGGSGTFDSCSFEGNSARVSTHGYAGLEIELSVVNCWMNLCSFGNLFLKSSCYCCNDVWLRSVAHSIVCVCGCHTDIILFPLILKIE